MQFIKAQDTIQNPNNKSKIETLQKIKEQIQNEERNILKVEVEAINNRLEKGEITSAEAELLKKEVAKKRALNIENRMAIIDNKIALSERNEEGYEFDERAPINGIVRVGGANEHTSENFIYVGAKENDKPKNLKYDRRTTSDFVLAFGLNNALIEGENIRRFSI